MSLMSELDIARMNEEGVEDEKPILHIIGADGNAFNLLGLARRAAREAGWPKDKIDATMKEAAAGDYNYLLNVLQERFDVR